MWHWAIRFEDVGFFTTYPDYYLGFPGLRFMAIWHGDMIHEGPVSKFIDYVQPTRTGDDFLRRRLAFEATWPVFDFLHFA